MPFIVYYLRAPTPPSNRHLFIAAAVFGAAFITDQFDGLIARSLNQVTHLGKILDPLADKILVVTSLILLVHIQLIPVWIAIVLSCRELVVNALRALAQSDGITLLPNWIGKSKAYFEGFGIAFAMLGPMQTYGDIQWWGVGMFLLYLAVVAALISATQYFYLYYTEIKKFPM